MKWLSQVDEPLSRVLYQLLSQQDTQVMCGCASEYISEKKDTFHWACKLKQTNKNIYKADIMLFGANETDLVFMQLDVSLTSCSPFLPPSPRHFGPSRACLQSTLALGASNWKWYWGWESSVSTLIPPLGEAHMVSITPQPRTLGPLSMLFLSISPACSSANAPGRTLFFWSLCY